MNTNVPHSQSEPESMLKSTMAPEPSQSALSALSLSTEDYSSRYSSLQDTESLRSAILDSFRMHWVQAWSIMEFKILNDITMDDLSSIVNHLEQMISLLVEENTNDSRTMHSLTTSEAKPGESGCQIDSGMSLSLSPLLDFLFVESILEKIFQWSEMSGEWKYAMYLEQLKLYELLVSQPCQAEVVLYQQPFLKPLIRLFDALSTFLLSNLSMVNCVEIEKRLVLLLNTLCVAISQNPRLLDAFLVHTTDESGGSEASEGSDTHSSPTSLTSRDSLPFDKSAEVVKFNFPVLLLLIQFVHRDGAIGQQARDALLLCMSLTRFDERLAHYVAKKTDFCPVLATGLSAHFCSLPRVLIGHSMSAEQFQFKDDILHNSQEIELFLKCLDFCNAVVQISHPIIQLQLLKYIYNGFLISVIGPALHQDVANVSIVDLETISNYSNTLDEIVTTTAYLDLFIRSISEPNLIRIFLEFMCFEVHDHKYITDTLISRIAAKSKLSLTTLILFKTLLDLNCEDLLFELIFRYLLRGKHLSVVENDSAFGNNSSEVAYQRNWLAVSAQKLFSNSLSYYLSSLCPQHSMDHSFDESDSKTVLDPLLSCRCHSTYFGNYLDYLNDARLGIEQCAGATNLWKNSYFETCDLLNEVQDENIIFCTMENNLNNNSASEKAHSQHDDELYVKDIISQSSLLAKLSHGFKMKNCYYDERSKRINFEYKSLFGLQGRSGDFNGPDEPPIGLFLTTLFERLEKFFENDVLTNLHLTGLITRLCHFSHKLLLSLLFDETLPRAKGVPCLIHLLQKLSLEAQNCCDEIPNFESMFYTAKINLQSMPIGELNCQLLTANPNLRASNSSLSREQDGNPLKSLGKLKNFFFRSNNQPKLQRRNSNASIASNTSQMLEVNPTGVRYINQNSKQKESAREAAMTDKFNELIYNLIIFDEFLMELSAILIEHSIRTELDIPD